MTRLLACACFLFLAATASAASDIRVSDAWARAMPPVVKTTAGYLVIENRGDKDDVLLGACIDDVDVAEMHEMVYTKGGPMRMWQKESVPVPAGGQVKFAPGGLHLMLIDAQRPLRAGEKLEGVLHFRDAGDVPVVLELRGQ